MSDKTCSTCHYWVNAFEADGMRPCLRHNGLNKTKAAKVSFGTKLLRTSSDFGCVDWEVDKREPCTEGDTCGKSKSDP
jgi:hypothetical protein